MEKPVGFKPVVKGALLYVVFLILYMAYRYIPFFPLSIIAGTTESNFQHYKATFFTFLLVNLIEYLVYRKQIKDGQGFWYGRLMQTLFAPWVVFLVWYIAPAVYGKFPQTWMEAVYANVMIIVVIILTVNWERGFLQIKPTRSLWIILGFLLLVSLMLYMVFTFSHLPWADVFIEPQWR